MYKNWVVSRIYELLLLAVVVEWVVCLLSKFEKIYENINFNNASMSNVNNRKESLSLNVLKF